MLDAIENDKGDLNENNEPGSLFDAVRDCSSKSSGIVSKHGESISPRMVNNSFKSHHSICPSQLLTEKSKIVNISGKVDLRDFL